MADYCEGCENLADIIERLEDAFDDGVGPPDELADAWFTQHVVSLNYPRVKRDLEPMSGQMRLGEMTQQALRETVAEDLGLTVDELDDLLDRIAFEK
jgi:hypothetical protein